MKRIPMKAEQEFIQELNNMEIRQQIFDKLQNIEIRKIEWFAAVEKRELYHYEDMGNTLFSVRPDFDYVVRRAIETALFEAAQSKFADYSTAENFYSIIQENAGQIIENWLEKRITWEEWKEFFEGVAR